LDLQFKRQGFSDDQKFKAAYVGLLGEVRGINIRSASTAADSDKTVTTWNSKIWEEFDTKIEKLTAESNPTTATTTELDKYITTHASKNQWSPALVDWQEGLIS
jgi:hypothetical protein